MGLKYELISNIEDKGFYIMYVKSGNKPTHIFFENRIDVTSFLMKNLNNIDLLTINGTQVDKNKLVNDNLKLNRYLKLNKIKDEI